MTRLAKSLFVAVGRLAAAALLMVFAWGAQAQPQSLVVGIDENLRANLQPADLEPLARLLSDRLGLEVTVRSMNRDALDEAVVRNEIGLLITGPSHYLTLRSRSALAGVLATVVRRNGNIGTASLGGVIVTRSDSAIDTLPALRGRRVAIPNIRGVATYHAQALELRDAGLSLPDDAKVVPVANAAEAVAAVRQGRADAGFARAGVLEDLIARGRLKPGELTVVNEQRLSGYPFSLSTRLYPEWPAVALPTLDPTTVRRLAATLLAIDPDHPALKALGLAGFDPPADYLPVEQLSRALGQPPYDVAAPVRLRDLYRQYRPTIVLALLAAGAVVALLVLLARRNRLLIAGNRQLHQSRQLLQTVIDTAPVRVFWKDRSLRFLGANRGFAQDQGLPSADQVIGKDDFALVDEAQARRHQSDDRRVLDSGQPLLGFDVQTVGAEGQPLWLRASKVPLRDDTGDVFGVLGIYEDVSDLRQREQQVLETRNQLQATLDALPDLMFEIDLDGVYQGAHSPRSDLLAAPIDSLIGRRVDDVLPPDVVALCHQAMQQALHLGHCDGLTYPLDLQGGRRWFELSVARKAMPDGAVPRFIFIARDITARKEAESELQRHRHDLEALVAARTSELVAARDAAEDASRAKSAFLANMSHEIRTPLNAVIGMAHLLRRSELTAQQQGWLQSLSGAGEHLLEVLNAILDLSKIEAGKFLLEAEPVDLRTVVANVHSMVAERAAERGLQLQLQLPEGVPALLGDATRLQQALLNYAHNAIKFTPAGRVTLRLNLADVGEGMMQARFEVEDTGIGIDADTLARLFNTFEQADNSSTRHFGGTGLGLAITRRLAGLMGGEAGAHSQPGQGSTFWFTVRLPLATARSDGPAPAPDDGSGWSEVERRLRLERPGRRVLLAEDDPINREVATELLELAGQVVDVAVDGEQAVQMAASAHYDLVLMDMQMPRLDGLAAARRIRALPEGASLPIVALTANAFADDRNRCLQAGMNDFIAKPLDMAELYGVLLRWLK